MPYADITFKDKNPIKRKLQYRRLRDAIQLADLSLASVVLDFGAGNGELCKSIALLQPQIKVICYEPATKMMEEARENLAGLNQVEFCTEAQSIAKGSVDLLYCLEVFEHIPEDETPIALSQMYSILRDQGVAVIGVPIEIGLPALYKGIFRMTRRFGEFDAKPLNILRSALVFPPRVRPVAVMEPNVRYHRDHMGFDYRRFREILRQRFQILRTSTSPFGLFGTLVNPEFYFIVKKVNRVPQEESLQTTRT